MGEASILPDTVISLAAIAGLLILSCCIRSGGSKNHLKSRFKALIWLVALLLAARILYWYSDSSLFRFATHTTGAFIPVVALLLTEGLLRRHAPKAGKFYVLVTAVALSAAALWSDIRYSGAYNLLMGAYQVSGFLFIAALIIRRDRGSLSNVENLTIDRIGLSLLFIVPFLAFDYGIGVIPMPVRLSGLAILVMCWLSLSLWRPKQRRELFVMVLGLYFCAAGFAAVILAWQISLDWREAVQVGAILLAVGFLAAIGRDALHLREESKQDAVFAGIGLVETPSLTAYIAGLEERGVLDGVLVLEDAALAEFDRAAIAARFEDSLALSASDLPTSSSKDSLADSQLRALFDRYAATHLVQVSRDPFWLAAVRQPGFAPNEIDPDLSAAFRHAQLISERDRLRDLLAVREQSATCR